MGQERSRIEIVSVGLSSLYAYARVTERERENMAKRPERCCYEKMDRGRRDLGGEKVGFLLGKEPLCVGLMTNSDGLHSVTPKRKRTLFSQLN